MAIFTRKTPFIEYIKFIETFAPVPACEEAVIWCKSINDKTLDCTFGQGIDALVEAPWACWCLRQTELYLDDETRKGFLEKITDPMQAFNIYCHVKSLTEVDGILLKEKFETLLPVAEKELLDGDIIKESTTISVTPPVEEKP